MMKPVRILHVIGIMNRGGAETMIMNLYRNIDRSAVQFDFVENTEETGVFEEEIIRLGGRIYHCPKFSGNPFSYMKWWNSFFDSHKDEYSFVHGHIGSTAAMYLSAAKKHGIRTIAHSHSTYTKGFRGKQFLYQILSYPTRNIADYFFACSTEAGISRYGSHVPLTILNNAIDTSLYSFDEMKKADVLAELGIEEGVPVFGHVGRFTAEKNHTFILDVFACISGKMKAELLLAGDGPLRKEMERKAVQLGIDRYVHFLGVREDIPLLLQGMDVMLFPSLFEGLPVTLVEAQCSGLRCLISDQISKETILVPELISEMSLEESAERWAEKAAGLLGYERRSYASAITEKGYDIHRSSEWLREFYLEKGTHYE